jgi:cobalt-zinc-cadmium efflux system protein
VHDLHASTVATGLPTLTAHVVVEDECFTDGHAAEVLHEVRECVAGHFPVSIQHSTFQIETAHLTEDEPALVRHR